MPDPIKKTVLLLADQYFNPSGVGEFTRSLIHALLDAGRHNYVLAYAGDTTRLQRAVSARVFRLPDRHLLWPVWHAVGRPLLETVTGPVDLVHALSASVRVPTQAPLVATIHDLAVVDRPNEVLWRRRWFGKRKLQAFARSAHAYAISQATAARWAAFAKRDVASVPVIHHGVDHSLFKPASDGDQVAVRRRLGLGDAPYFLFSGVISPRKNLGMLMRAFSRFPRPERRHRLVLTCPYEGYEETALHRLIATLGLGARVKFTGAVERTDLPALYSGATALVHPSAYEGFGFPVLEAMACGTPVICADATSLPEIAGDAALRVAPDDQAGWLAAMELLASDGDKRRGLIAAGRDQAAAFDWAKTATLTADYYDDILR